MKSTRLMQYLFFCGCLAGGTARAEEGVAAVPEDSTAPVLRAGGVDIYPGISLAEQSNDNIFRTNTGKKSSLITVVSPSVLMQAKSGANTYALSYNADLARYAQSSADNYDDQTLAANAELAFSSRATLKLTPQLKVGHDDRGSTYSGPTATPNRWHNSGLAGSFIYGSEESIGRIQLDADAYAIRYQNNRTVASVFDRDMNDIAATFYYRAAPKLYTFIQLSETRISYSDPAAVLSGRERFVFLGADWRATAQTNGSFKVGQLHKTFDSVGRLGFSGASWEGSVRWSPREFVRLDLITSRKTTEATGVGDYVLVANHALDLGYDLNERATLHLKAGNLTESFGQTGRSDSTPSYGLKADYKLRSWLEAGAEFANSVKTSTGYTGLNPSYSNKKFVLSLRSKL